MSTLAIADVGEFWYGDYKEPFEQFEGGIPGYPKGVVLYEPDTLKLLCAYWITRAATICRLSTSTAVAIIHRYGYPFAQRDRSPERLAWAADMAHRLRGEERVAA